MEIQTRLEDEEEFEPWDLEDRLYKEWREERILAESLKKENREGTGLRGDKKWKKD